MNAAIQPATPATDYATVTAPRTVRLQRLMPGPSERIWSSLSQSDLRRESLAVLVPVGHRAPSAFDRDPVCTRRARRACSM